MTRSLGSHVPDDIRAVLDGSDLARREGATILLLTTDEAGWPHMAMLSVGEVVATDPRTLRAALWLRSTTTKNLDRTGRATLALVANGSGYYLRVSAHRGADLDLGADGRLAYFVLQVDDVLEDAADYATLTSGVTFRLNHPEQVLPRWQHTIEALKSAAA